MIPQFVIRQKNGQTFNQKSEYKGRGCNKKKFNMYYGRIPSLFDRFLFPISIRSSFELRDRERETDIEWIESKRREVKLTEGKIYWDEEEQLYINW